MKDHLPVDAGPVNAGPVNAVPVNVIAERGTRILDEINRAVVGMREPLTIALATILAGGHILFEDVPGVGKTLAARCLARTLGLEFTRLQCTPDLLPSDITGAMVFDPRTQVRSSLTCGVVPHLWWGIQP